MKGDLFMNTLMQKNIVGIKDLRTNLSSIIDRAILDFEIIRSGNIKKGSANTVTIISTSMYEDMLSGFTFSPIIQFDEETSQWEVLINEISVYACAKVKLQAIGEAIELIIDNTNEFIENKEVYLRMEKYKKVFPYYLRIENCRNIDEVKKLIGLCESEEN